MLVFLQLFACNLLVLLIVVVVIYVCMYIPKHSTMASIRKVTDRPDFNLYTMDYSADYKLDAIVSAGAESTRDFTNLVVRALLPGVPIHIDPIELGCSCCFAPDVNGNYMMGRNFDLEDTSGVLIHTKPENGYESIGFANAGFTGITNVTGHTGRIASLLLPYTTLDGMNEKGFACCMLWLDDKPTKQETGKTPITTTVALRLLLDRAANVDEAIALLKQYDMRAVSGGDYHFLLADASGRSVIAEWPEPTDELVVIEKVEAATNFFLTEIPETVNPGHGQDRYESIQKVLEENHHIMTVDTMFDALESAQQIVATDTSGTTQWSNVYELNFGRVHTVFHREWKLVFDFSFDDFRSKGSV